MSSALELPLKFQFLTPNEMDGRKHKGLCYNCEEKFVKGYKYKEQKLFHMDMQEQRNSKEVTTESLQQEDDQDQPQ